MSQSVEDDSSSTTPAVADPPAVVAATEDLVKQVEKLEVQDMPGMRQGLTLDDYRKELLVEYADPNSPIHSIKSFTDLGLSEPLLKGVTDGMKFDRPSRIQETALPIILSNPPTNLVAQSQSGTGKTAAFALGMLSRCTPEQVPQAICLANTHELAGQIAGVVEKMGQFTPYKVFLATPLGPKASDRITSQIVVGTPGTVENLIRSRKLPTNKVKVFVLDEADKMLEAHGLRKQTSSVREKCGRDCQVLFFSATFTEEIMKFVSTLMDSKPCATIRLESNQLAIKKIQQLYIDCKSEANKFQILSDIYLLMNIGQSIIFANRRDTVEKLAERLKKEHGFETTTMTGDKDSAERKQTMDDFYAGKTKALIATDLASRGIDNIQVTLVVNYDVPVYVQNNPRGGVRATTDPDPETYYHRIGRAGRFGRQGVAITLVHDAVTKRQVTEAARAIGADITEYTGDIEDLGETLKKMELQSQ